MAEKNIKTWALEAKGADGEPWVTPLTTSPFRIGRRDDCELRLASDSISRLHAEIRWSEQGIWIKDAGSTNGTFVNFHRISGELQLQSGDTVHFAGLEFRVEGRAEAGAEGSDRTVMVNPYVEKLDQLIARKAVVPHFQPIVDLRDNRIFGHELLGRVGCEGVPSSIPQLFYIAKQLGRDIELSLLFRDTGIEQAVGQKTQGLIFFNTVPREMDLAALDRSLGILRAAAPRIGLALEIHENAITDIGFIRRLKEVLRALDIQLVYDDFGAGQSRLLELMDAPPDILKFDISLVRNIHLRSPASLRMVAALVGMSKDLGVLTLAEGIERVEEAGICRQIGFDLAQGFYFGKPSPSLSR
ncbi:EAL domain, c-di-GMP-specific phosphodiesterase class I (or its enzymatically inactive variant) [Methylomagnum ishizawai]|uniref:EAL domain, c-di-GMP-specific phosphodiesterase class I (Or its enzymatically inactive variant) n=1 Tax=Methylomagnum ishizawai TaxID=1760988 RepID=A0A1Y6CYF3_9GAMM|nr:EAL domain-containing protein [Methylomagnum ishizawai]SMF95407.1 EAL domain, c-di-GMP-specific phosphodiesterase class I (or its enzymatically inactive variant) [Methylomagnum ishizawai]